jgi:hypothetical protein
LLTVSYLAYLSTLTMGATCSSETLFHFRRTTIHYFVQDRILPDSLVGNVTVYEINAGLGKGMTFSFISASSYVTRSLLHNVHWVKTAGVWSSAVIYIEYRGWDGIEVCFHIPAVMLRNGLISVFLTHQN